MVYIFRNLFVLQEYVLMLMISKLLKQGYQYHKLHKEFSKLLYLLKDLSATRHIRTCRVCYMAYKFGVFVKEYHDMLLR